MRSCASESQISQGARPGYFKRHMLPGRHRAPIWMAISPTAEESPPAPQSVMALYRPCVAGAHDDIDQAFFGDRVADLHRSAGDFAGLGIHGHRGEGRAAQAVPPGAPAEHDDAVAGLRVCADACPWAQCPHSRRRPADWRYSLDRTGSRR